MTEKIIFANTQGFQNKKEQINKIVLAHRPIVLLIAEHFQCDQKKLDKIIGYTLCAVFCRDSQEKGGVAVYVRVDILCIKRPDLDKFQEKKLFEVASVEIPARGLVVTAIYRPPKSSKESFNSKLESFLDLYNQEPEKNHLMAGDFNIDNSKSNSTEKILLKRGFQFALSTKTHDYGACLDNFIVDFEPSKTRVLRSKIDKVSDHRPIELILPYFKQKFNVCIDPWKSYRVTHCPTESDVSSDYESCDDYSVLSDSQQSKMHSLSALMNDISVKASSSSSSSNKRGRSRGRGRGMARPL